ncbi:MAG: protein kinase domain-containing protein [Prosthecobacter sp.]
MDSQQLCRACRAPVGASPMGDVCPVCLLLPAVEELFSDTGGPPQREREGDRIGRYVLVEPVGEGGFGMVWRAEQLEPFPREVALKILKAGMDTREVIARFEQERLALTLMDHPGIAQVFDAGMTGAGRPYFVMELVHGTPVTEHVKERGLDVEARLRLFIHICAAIQHAHQKGIIHRDIKPSNILVAEMDGEAVPKVIDFGIAKALEAPPGQRALVTQMHQMMGTPAYMSPEQLDSGTWDTDTRSDIYSLGVLLYEMLTGQPPFEPAELAAAGQDEMRRIIRQVQPARPSTRVSLDLKAEEPGSPRNSRVSPRLALETDLDWIVMKCLEKEPDRRYDTASDLAQDIQRHLRHEPVLARPPSAAYHLKKLLRRNKATCLAVAAVFLALGAGITVSTLQMLRAQRAEALKNAEAARAREAEQTALHSLAELRVAHEKMARQQYAGVIKQAAGMINGPERHRVSALLWNTTPALRHWEWGWLMAQCDQPLLHWDAREETIRQMAVEEDGSRLYLGANHVSAWETATQRRLWTQKAPGRTADLAPHPGRRWVAVVRNGPNSAGLQVLDAGDGQVVFEDTTQGWQHCVWAPDGSRLYLQSKRHVTFFEAETWRRGPTGDIHDGGTLKHSLVVDQDNRFVALPANWDGPWHLHSTENMARLHELGNSVAGREFGGGFMASSRGLFVQAYGAELRVGDPRMNHAALRTVYKHPTDIKLVMAGPPRQGLLWVAGGQKMVALQGESIVAERFTSTPVTAMAAAADGRVFYGDQQGHVRCINGLAAGMLDAETIVPDNSGGRFLVVPKDGPGVIFYRHALPQAHLVSMPDGRSLKEVPELPNRCFIHPPYRSQQGLPTTHPVSGEVVCAGESTLNFHLRTADGSWQTRRMTVKPRPMSAAFATQGTRMIVACADGLWVYDSPEGTPRPAPFQSAGAGVLDLTPDGRVALFAGKEHVRVWEVETGRMLYDRMVPGGLHPVGALHPRGEILALSPHNHMIQIVDLRAPAKPLRTLACGGRWPHGVRFTLDGSRLFTMGPDDNIHWWDWQLGEKLLTLTEKGNVADVILDPDARSLTSAAGGVAVHVRRALPWWHAELSPEFQRAVEQMRR